MFIYERNVSVQLKDFRLSFPVLGWAIVIELAAQLGPIINLAPSFAEYLTGVTKFALNDKWKESNLLGICYIYSGRH